MIRQGIDEGVITTTAPDVTARLILYLVQGYQELAGEHFLARKAGTITFAEVQRTYAGFMEAFERILGVPHGSVTLMEEGVMRFWFG